MNPNAQLWESEVRKQHTLNSSPHEASTQPRILQALVVGVKLTLSERGLLDYKMFHLMF